MRILPSEKKNAILTHQNTHPPKLDTINVRSEAADAATSGQSYILQPFNGTITRLLTCFSKGTDKTILPPQVVTLQ